MKSALEDAIITDEKDEKCSSWHVKSPRVAPLGLFYWVLLILVVGGIGALLTALLSWCVVQVVKFYKDDYADEISLAEVLITFAVAVFFAEPIRSFIPLNMLVILLVVHAAYIGVRYLIMKD